MKRLLGALFAMALAVLPASAQFGTRIQPLTYCYDTTLSSAAALTAFTCASFTASGSGTTLTVSASTGLIQPGMTITGTGVPASTTITAQSSGTAGGIGTYTTSNATTSSSASLTASGTPTRANYAVICAYGEAVNYRDDGVAPTASSASGGQGISAGSCIGYNGTFTALQFIQQTSSAQVGVTFYSGN